jgi:Secretion system C-terminal sorting domain
MKSILQLFSACILIFTGGIIFAQTGSDYYLPLSVGNQLILHTEPTQNWSQRTSIFSIEGTDIIEGRECFRQIGTEISDLTSEIDTFHIFWLREDSVGNVIMTAVSIDGSENPDSAVVVNFNYFPNEYLTLGYSRTLSFGDIEVDSVVSVSETVVTHAGTFNNCIVILETQTDNQGNLIHTDYSYYAYGMGKVKNVRTFPPTDAHTDLLISYNVTGLNDEISSYTPDDFLLSQNYPNPFNPSTKISWQSPVGSWQTLKIYDVLGKEIVTLIDEFKSAGKYEVDFDASGLPSGVYLYRMTAGSFTETKKIILVK